MWWLTSRLCRAALAGLLVLGAASSEAAPPVRHVLLLLPFDRGNLTFDHFTGNFRVELDQRVGAPVNVVQIVVVPPGFVGAPEQALVDYIRSIYADRPKPELIVTVAAPALVFARKHRQQLFPETPMLFADVDQRFLNEAPLGRNETAVAVVNDYPRLIDDILQLLPRTKQVFVVIDSGSIGQFWRHALEGEFARFRDRLSFIWGNDLSLPDLLRRCATLPGDSAILYFTFGTDAQGGAYAEERVLNDLHAMANAPMFGAQSPMLGRGVVGGTMMAVDDLSRNAADAASRILNGEPPASIRIPPRSPGSPTFDWRELQRWGIAESRLPAGSVVLYRTSGLWREYRTTVLSAVAALIVQSLLIVGLLYQHRARRRAEVDSRRNLALAADASRRETMSALTSSIAHDLSQPLNSMMLNAQALQMMIAGNRATPDPIGEVLSDIETQGVRATQIIDRHRTMLRSRQLDKKPIDIHAVIRESVALVGHDLKAHEVATAIDLPSTPCVVSGDPVLLQQVLVNLFMNAIDAMAETPPARRQLRIRSEATPDAVEISVRDAGTGLPEHINGTVFTPFVTTKANGIGVGLTIARKIVDAHEGTIAARNNPEGGATFTITLNRRETPSALPGGVRHSS